MEYDKLSHKQCVDPYKDAEALPLPSRVTKEESKNWREATKWRTGNQPSQEDELNQCMKIPTDLATWLLVMWRKLSQKEKQADEHIDLDNIRQSSVGNLKYIFVKICDLRSIPQASIR